LPEVISRMRKAGVGTICVGTGNQASKEAVGLANNYENIWASIGVHPDDSKEDFGEDLFEELVKNKKVVCVGECGLDYHRNQENGEKERQKKLFRKQIEFALKRDLPLMLHVRPSRNSNDAHRDVLGVLERYKETYGEKLRGNSHFFASGTKIANRYFELGFTISFTGLITFVRDFDKVVKETSLDMLHIETDAPFVSPASRRGERNEPSYVIEVAKKISEIKGLPFEETSRKLLENSLNLFNL